MRWPESSILYADTLRRCQLAMLDFVRKYYGEILEKTEDLKTNACCTVDGQPSYVEAAIGRIHDDVRARYFGCGLVLPEAMRGCRVLDLGCGSGRDCYLLAQLVGPEGSVVGVDMTPAQIEVAEKYRDYHARKFGFTRSNVEFRVGYIEHLDELDLEPASFDVIVSNCVINLSPDKDAVLRGAHRLLKEGGEVYFADVYADRRVPADVASDPVLYGECLGGALYWNDFLGIAKAAGFVDPRLVTDRPIVLEDANIRKAVRGVSFYSATYRLFKVSGLESACEDYGQAVVYKGTIEHHPDELVLDQHHRIQTGRVFPVCGNTFDMLHASRLAAHFEFVGDKSRHYGIFPDCGTSIPFSDDGVQSNADASGACC